MTPLPLPDYLHCISIPTPFPVGPVNTYLVEGEPLTLVDTGPRYDPARRALTDALADRGYSVADLRRLVITHMHADHCGLTADLVRRSGAAVWTHTSTHSRSTEDESFIGATYRDARRLIAYARITRWAGVPMPLMIKLAQVQRGVDQYTEPFTPDHALRDGVVIRLGGEDWHVLHTPGHAGGLICLYQPSRRLLLSSDHLLRDISSNPVVDPPAPGQKEPPSRLMEYLDQLRRVAELDVTLALPGHGLPITDHQALIRRRLSLHEERAERILETLNGKALTARQIASRFFPDLDPINAFLAISEVIGHLQWLGARGHVVQEQCLGVARWRAVPGEVR